MKPFEQTKQWYQRHLDLVKEHTLLLGNDFSADEGVFWDGGLTLWGKHDRGAQWLAIVRKLRERAGGKTWGTFPNERLWEQRYPAD